MRSLAAVGVDKARLRAAGTRAVGRWLGAAAAGLALALPVAAQDEAPGAGAPEAVPAATQASTRSYPFQRLEIVYARDAAGFAGLPPIERIMAEVRVPLLREPGGVLVNPRPGERAPQYRLADLDGRANVLDDGALSSIVQAILQYIRDRGLAVFLVYVDPAQVATEQQAQQINDERALSAREGETPPTASEGDDLRADKTVLRIIIDFGAVRELRTIASGARVPAEQRIDSGAHRRIVDHSPVGKDTLLRPRALDDYIFRLNRHPGRRVDVAVSEAEAEGGVALDYLVNEPRPWYVLAQVSNTGTESTNEWRERFGFVNNQLTGRDDTLTLNYITACFDQSHAVTGSYEAPVFDADRLRWRATGTWSQFDASEVGLSGTDFHGDEWTVGGDLILNVFQHRELFIDLTAGVRYWDVRVDNTINGTIGHTKFLLPVLGAAVERVTETESTLGSLSLEWNVPDAAGTSETEMKDLGRQDVDAKFHVLRWSLAHSFFLEPVLNHREWSRAGPRPEDISPWARLAHELTFTFRGQHSFDERLIAQQTDVVGGFFTVRGYPESVVAGDTSFVGTAEYRFHVPRSFRPRNQTGTLFGRDFRYAPQQPYGQADWDLILRAFVDAGRVLNADRREEERDETLVGAGLGVELTFRRNMSLRADWGVALQPVRRDSPEEIDAGRSRFHLMATFLY